MTTRTDSIDASNGQSFDAYVSLPEAPNGHAVIVLQEIFGVTPHIRKVADRFAAAGYLAFAPDLFWRAEKGLSLSHSKEDIARAFALLGEFSDKSAVDDIAATLAHIHALPGFKGKVALAGMCLGGKLAYLGAAGLPVQACVAFYGVGIEKHLELASAIACPTLMFFGGVDKYVPAPARAAIEEAVKADAKVEVVVYPDADHGFYTRGAPETLQAAHERTLAFLAKALGASGGSAT